jgi:hypothetical protein
MPSIPGSDWPLSTLRRSWAAMRSSKSNPGPAVDRVVLGLAVPFFVRVEGCFSLRFAVFEERVVTVTPRLFLVRTRFIGGIVGG